MTTTNAELLDAMLAPSLRRLLHDAAQIARTLDTWATDNNVTLTATVGVDRSYQNALHVEASHLGDPFAAVDVTASLNGQAMFVTDLFDGDTSEPDDDSPEGVAAFVADLLARHLRVVQS